MGALCSQGVAPGVVGVGDHSRAGFVQDGGDIPLEVGGIVVSNLVEDHRHGRAGGIIGKVQGVASHSHVGQGAAIVSIAVSIGSIGFLCPQAVGIVGKAPAAGAVRHARQLSAVLPAVIPCPVGEHVADGIRLDRLAVVSGQQVAPGFVSVAAFLSTKRGQENRPLVPSKCLLQRNVDVMYQQASPM